MHTQHPKTRILFICHGNICRSPMAEFMMKNRVADAGRSDEFEIASAATSTEELGSNLYPPARETLRRHGVPFDRHVARQTTAADFARYDYIYLMDRNNLRNLRRLWPESVVQSEAFGRKVRLLMELCGTARDVADPWYTGDFECTYRDIDQALTAWFDTETASNYP